MTQITADQALQDATAAGFSPDAARTMVAIAFAESGLNPSATNTAGNSAGTDRGILQINSYYHSEVADSCAFDPACAFRAGFQISQGGANFQPWVTYDTGAYQQYLADVPTAAGSAPAQGSAPVLSSPGPACAPAASPTDTVGWLRYYWCVATTAASGITAGATQGAANGLWGAVQPYIARGAAGLGGLVLIGLGSITVIGALNSDAVSDAANSPQIKAITKVAEAAP